MGGDLPRGKFTDSHPEEEMNSEFEMSAVSNFFSLKRQPCQISKARQTLLRTLFWPLNPPSRSSRRGHFLRLQKSHPKEK